MGTATETATAAVVRPFVLLEEWHPSVMYGASACLVHHARQPRSHDLARLELQAWGERPDHRDAKLGPSEINGVHSNAKSSQPLESFLEAR